MSDEFLTVADIAELLKVNQQTVRNWVDRGELRVVRVGARRVRVRRGDFDAFLVKRRDAGCETSDTADLGEVGEDLAQAVEQTTRATSDDRDLAPALRDFAEAANRLAARLE